MPGKTQHAGESTRRLARKRFLVAVALVTVGLIALAVIWLLLRNAEALAIGGAGVLGLLVLLRVIPDLLEVLAGRHMKARDRAIRGAEAEEQVESLLQALDETYCILHDIASPYGNIDHVVIGQDQGVFMLETKSHRGRVTVADDRVLVNGRPPEKDFVAQALRNAYWLRGRIGAIVGVQVWITALLVLVNAFVPPSPPAKGVFVINKRFLLEHLAGRSTTPEVNARVWEAREKIREALCGQQQQGRR